MERLIGVLGLLTLLGAAWALSADRRAIRWRVIGWGLGLQLLLALVVLRFPPGMAALNFCARVVARLNACVDDGAAFLFGRLADDGAFGVIFVIKVLPTVVFVSSLFAILYHLGVLQLVVALMARAMRHLLGVSGAESLATAANVFMGQTEAPLAVAPYIRDMTRSELCCLMTGGMATVSGSVLMAFTGLGIRAEHLLTASVMSAPAAIMMAKLLLPETETPRTAGSSGTAEPGTDVNLIDAAARGATQGVQLAINIAAMLLAFIALIALANAGLGWLGETVTGQGLTLEGLLGYLFAPLACLMGVAPADCLAVGGLLGKKIVFNEFVAYVELTELIRQGALGGRAELIASFALCGFANIASIGVQIGGIGPLAPDRRHELARLGPRAMLGGALASFQTATLAGIVVGI